MVKGVVQNETKGFIQQHDSIWKSKAHSLVKVNIYKTTEHSNTILVHKLFLIMV